MRWLNAPAGKPTRQINALGAFTPIVIGNRPKPEKKKS
jgi:hypothetical protein